LILHVKAPFRKDQKITIDAQRKILVLYVFVYICIFFFLHLKNSLYLLEKNPNHIFKNS